MSWTPLRTVRGTIAQEQMIRTNKETLLKQKQLQLYDAPDIFAPHSIMTKSQIVMKGRRTFNLETSIERYTFN